MYFVIEDDIEDSYTLGSIRHGHIVNPLHLAMLTYDVGVVNVKAFMERNDAIEYVSITYPHLSIEEVKIDKNNKRYLIVHSHA